MILSILTACHAGGAPSPELAGPSAGGHYVKVSAKRFSMPASPVKKRNNLKRKSVVIGTPTGFKHEFHLGRDVNSVSELWDLERWREEIESRVQEAAVQHAAINAAAAQDEETASTPKKPRPQSMIKRKPVPALADEGAAPPLPLLQTPESNPETSNTSTSTSMLMIRSSSESSVSRAEAYSSATSSSCNCNSSEEDHDTASLLSSLPPATPPSSNSPRVSTDLKYADVNTGVGSLEPVVEIEIIATHLEGEGIDSALIASTLRPKPQDLPKEREERPVLGHIAVEDLNEKLEGLHTF